MDDSGTNSQIKDNSMNQQFFFNQLDSLKTQKST